MTISDYVAVAVLVLRPVAALTEPAALETSSEFQLVIHQNGDTVTGLNMAFGSGANVSFFSNIDASTTWTAETGPVRTGTYAPVPGTDVVLGVCAGGNCSVSGGLSFTTPVGQGLELTRR